MVYQQQISWLTSKTAIMTIIMQKILYKTSDENLITYFFQKNDVIVGNL